MNEHNIQQDPKTENENLEIQNSIQFPPKITFEDIREHLTGPVISVAAHIILLGFLCTLFIPAEPRREYKEFIIEPMKIEPLKIDKLDVPEEPLASNEEIDVPRNNNEDTSTKKDPDVDFSPNDLPEGLSQENDLPAINNLPKFADSVSVFVFPAGNPLGSRNPDKIAGILKGENAEKTDFHVVSALNWLKEHQNEDGSWGEDKSKRPALTGLAALTFLGKGITPMSQKYGKTLVMALKKLVEFGNDISANGVINGDGNGYCHPIVAYAVSEAYTMTKIPHLEDVMNKMVGVIVQGQNKYGSFNYRYNNAPDQKTGEARCDLSYAGWNFQALKAAFTASSSVPGIENAIGNSINAIVKKHSATDGSFCYGAGGSRGTLSMTSVGTLCLQLLNAGKSPYVEKGLKWMMNANGGKSMNSEWKDNSGNAWAIYTWYYQTQAIYQGSGEKGDAWKKWNDKFLKGALIREQESDGHWSSPYEKYGVSRNGQGHGEGTGSVFKDSSLDLHIYSTSLCCLMLEVYYRYLPTYKVALADEKKGTIQFSSEEKLLIE
ncbi:MAG: prenyltransferase/squalene oxidase repeat-containing protein [Victivallales bacterium]